MAYDWPMRTLYRALAKGGHAYDRDAEASGRIAGCRSYHGGVATTEALADALIDSYLPIPFR
jgi:hypothetical protein